MHDDLLNLLTQLPADVYQALVMSSGMSYKARIKLQDSCRRGNMANLSLWQSARPQRQPSATRPSLADGAHFDPPKRGLALAGAGRPAAVAGASGQTLSNTVTREAHLRTLRDQWTDALPAFATDTELSCSYVNKLWNGVNFIMTIRAARASTWGVREVEDACVPRQQLASLPGPASGYWSDVVSVVSRVATALRRIPGSRSLALSTGRTSNSSS